MISFYTIGSIYPIYWNDFADNTTSVKIEISIDNKISWTTIATGIANDATYEFVNCYEWTVDVILNQESFVRITSEQTLEFVEDQVEYSMSQSIHGLSIINNPTIGFKKESIPYTGEILTAADYNQNIYDLKISPNIESYIRKLATGDYSRSPSIAGKRMCAINFKIDLYAINNTTAPEYFSILECCGWRRIAHGSTGISIQPDSNSINVPATIEAVFPQEGLVPKQIVYKITGAMGSVKIIAETGKPVTFEFSFIGALDNITTRGYSNRIVPTISDAYPPRAFLSGFCNFFGRYVLVNNFEINSNEVCTLFSNIFSGSGYSGARVEDRVIQAVLDIDQPFAELIQGTTDTGDLWQNTTDSEHVYQEY